jgi:hypothetical protein
VDQIKSIGVRKHTRKFTWLGPFKVNLSDGDAGEVPLLHLGREVESDDLLIAWIEAEPRRQLKVTVNFYPMWLLVLASRGSLLLK